mgnify:CR=1 FL=1
MYRSFDRRMARFFYFSLAIAFCLGLVTTAQAQVRSRVEGEALIAEKPLEPSSYEIYAEFLSGNGAHDEAAEVLERGRTKALPSANLLVALSEAYEAQGLLGRAESVTREALMLDPEHVRAHLRMGDLYFRLGWPKSGLESYQQAVALAPGDPAPMVRLVAGHLEASQMTVAEDTCLEFISLYPDQPDLWLSLGQVFEKQEKRRAAFTTYGQVLTLDPQNSLAYARQGRLFCQFGQFTSAEAACRRALELDPDNKLAHAYLGIAFSYLGNNEAARKHAQIAEAAGLNMMSVWDKIGH